MAKNKYRVVLVDVSPKPEESELGWFALDIKSNKLCPFIPLKDGIFKQLDGYHLIRKDLEFAEAALKKLLGMGHDGDNVIKMSLGHAAFVAYAKSFTSTDGRGIRLEAAEIFKGASEEIIASHKHIMEQRNEYISHAGKGYEETNSMLALSPDVENKERYGLYFNMHYATEPNEKQIAQSLKLLEYLKQCVEKKLDVILPRARDETEKVDLDECYKKAEYPLMNFKQQSKEITLTAPPGGVLESIKISVSIEAENSGLLIYTDSADNPILAINGSTELDIYTQNPVIYIQKINVPISLEIKTLGWTLKRE